MAPSLPGRQTTVGPKFIAWENLEGLLFDVDGTLIDTMPLFFKSWAKVCPDFGLSMTMDDFYGYAGKPLPDIVKALYRSQKGREATQEEVDTFLAAKKDNHKANEGKFGHPAPIACVVKIAREAVAAGIPCAVATSGLRDHVVDHLHHAGLDDLFNSTKNNIVCAAEVAKGKPAPDVYLEAAKRIGVDPAKCRAYEDGESGLISAYAAGCHVIDVTSMAEYPTCDGLQRAKLEQVRTRDWLPKSPLPKAASCALVAVSIATVAAVVAFALKPRA